MLVRGFISRRGMGSSDAECVGSSHTEVKTETRAHLLISVHSMTIHNSTQRELTFCQPIIFHDRLGMLLNLDPCLGTDEIRCRIVNVVSG